MRGVRLVVLGGALAVACAYTDLEQVPATVQPLNDKFSVTGQFCTGLPNPADFPVRILFIADISGSTVISDPPVKNCGAPVCLTRRAQAVVDTMKKYPPGVGIAYGLITFASNASILTTGK